MVMTACGQCQQQNPDDAKFCHQCGSKLVEAKPVSEPPAEAHVARTTYGDDTLWRQFIGPNADHYLTVFKRFSSNGQPKFALSWNWPAFFPQVSFLWFLYRKMYVHAFVYAIGPVVATVLTGDLSSSLVWCVMAGATGNYLYYWYCREHISEIKKAGQLDQATQEAVLKESGGVQPYVIWVGIALFIFSLVILARMAQEGRFAPDIFPNQPPKQAAMLKTPGLEDSGYEGRADRVVGYLYEENG